MTRTYCSSTKTTIVSSINVTTTEIDSIPKAGIPISGSSRNLLKEAFDDQNRLILAAIF
jgi:hypothetical protein